jgi:hypothetical protein
MPISLQPTEDSCGRYLAGRAEAVYSNQLVVGSLSHSFPGKITDHTPRMVYYPLPGGVRFGHSISFVIVHRFGR